MNKRFRILLIVGVVCLVGIIIATGFYLVDRSTKTATIELTVAPSSSEILVNGKTYRNGAHHVVPGDYNIEVSHEGFERQTQSVSIAAGETAEVYILLIQLDGSEDWYASHPEDMALTDAIKSYQMQENVKKLQTKYPLITKLPINIDFYSNNYSERTRYSISYRQTSDTDVVIVITDYTGGNYENALEKIRARGYKPEDYIIEYEDKAEAMDWGSAF